MPRHVQRRGLLASPPARARPVAEPGLGELEELSIVAQLETADLFRTEREQETVVVHADVVAELLDDAVDTDIDQPELASSDGDGGAALCPEGNGLTEEEGRMRS